MKKIASLLLFISFCLTTTIASANDLDDFSKKVDTSLEIGIQCENDLSMEGKAGVNKKACQTFIAAAQQLGETREAMQQRLENILNSLDWSQCDEACQAKTVTASIGIIQVVYILDYIDFTKED